MRARIPFAVLLLAWIPVVHGFQDLSEFAAKRPGRYLDGIPAAPGTDLPAAEAPRVGAGTSKGLWPDARVYYVFAEGLSDFTKGLFEQAFRAWEADTPLRFIERTDEPNYIEIVYSEITSSGVGMGGGRQLLFITPYTHTPLGTVLHEIGHAIGLQHEHQRGDRDTYIEVFPENVLAANVTQISLVLNTVNYTPYDFLSIMHYGRKTLSANLGDTIRPREEYIEYLSQIGQRDSLSVLDREGVRKMYSFMPLPLSPADGEWTYGPRPVTFRWSGFPDAEIYQLQIARDSGFVSIIHDEFVGPVDVERWAIEPQSASWSPPNEDGVYYWRVRCSISGRYRAWSDPSRLFVRAKQYRTAFRPIHPNPASGPTTIPFDLREGGHVRAVIVSMDGRELAVLLDDDLAAGEHSLIWHPGSTPSGVYLVVLETALGTVTRTLILAR